MSSTPTTTAATITDRLNQYHHHRWKPPSTTVIMVGSAVAAIVSYISICIRSERQHRILHNVPILQVGCAETKELVHTNDDRQSDDEMHPGIHYLSQTDYHTIEQDIHRTGLMGKKRSVKEELDYIRTWHHDHGFKGGIVLRDLTLPLPSVWNNSADDDDHSDDGDDAVKGSDQEQRSSNQDDVALSVDDDDDVEEELSIELDIPVATKRRKTKGNKRSKTSMTWDDIWQDPSRLARRECYYLYYEVQGNGAIVQEIFCRGTTLWVDIWTCLQAWTVYDADLGCRVHAGFHYQAERILQDVLPLLLAGPTIPAPLNPDHNSNQRQRASPPPPPQQQQNRRQQFDQQQQHQHQHHRSSTLAVCGHSLGGAVASLLAVKLRQRGYNVTRLTTIGEPRFVQIMASPLHSLSAASSTTSSSAAVGDTRPVTSEQQQQDEEQTNSWLWWSRSFLWWWPFRAHQVIFDNKERQRLRRLFPAQHWRIEHELDFVTFLPALGLQHAGASKIWFTPYSTSTTGTGSSPARWVDHCCRHHHRQCRQCGWGNNNPSCVLGDWTESVWINFLAWEILSSNGVPHRIPSYVCQWQAIHMEPSPKNIQVNKPSSVPITATKN